MLEIFCCEIDLELTCRFLFRFTGKDEEVNLLGDGTERPEFSEWSWMTPQQLLDLVRIPDFLLILSLLK